MSTQSEQSKTLTKPAANKRELREWLQGEQFKRELAALLPRTMSPERFVRIAFQATHANPDLLKCSQESFFNCLLKLGAMGLEPDSRRAHLIPFGTECTLIIDYKGLKELVRRNGDVSVMHGDVVGENDEFNLRFGTHGILDHKPNLQNVGKILGAYSWVKLPDGNEEYDWMNVGEIESVRRRSKSANKGPWVTDWNEMAKKTVFRRHAKGLPLSPQTRDALESSDDGDALTEAERFNAAAPAKASVMGGSTLSRQRSRASLAADEGEQISEGSAALSESPKEPVVDDKTTGSMGTASAVQSAEARYLALVGQIRDRLAQAGFSESELLALMKGLRLAPKAANSLGDCAEVHITQVLEEWDNCKLRLEQEREARSAAVP